MSLTMQPKSPYSACGSASFTYTWRVEKKRIVYLEIIKQVLFSEMFILVALGIYMDVLSMGSD